jgi:hypothetical protein
LITFRIAKFQDDRQVCFGRGLDINIRRPANAQGRVLRHRLMRTAAAIVFVCPRRRFRPPTRNRLQNIFRNLFGGLGRVPLRQCRRYFPARGFSFDQIGQNRGELFRGSTFLFQHLGSAVFFKCGGIEKLMIVRCRRIGYEQRGQPHGGNLGKRRRPGTAYARGGRTESQVHFGQEWFHHRLDSHCCISSLHLFTFIGSGKMQPLPILGGQQWQRRQNHLVQTAGALAAANHEHGRAIRVETKSHATRRGFRTGVC